MMLIYLVYGKAFFFIYSHSKTFTFPRDRKKKIVVHNNLIGQRFPSVGLH